MDRDVVYIFCSTGGEDAELRYSLRSLAASQVQPRKVWVFGDRPAWLADDTRIIEHDDVSNISIDDVTAAEGTSPTGWTRFTFTVTLSKPVPTAFTIDYETIAVSATGTGNADYVHIGTPVTITIPANTTTTTITVNVRPDSVAGEGNETFTVRLSNIVVGAGFTNNIDFQDDEGTGTITDDD